MNANAIQTELLVSDTNRILLSYGTGFIQRFMSSNKVVVVSRSGSAADELLYSCCKTVVRGVHRFSLRQLACEIARPSLAAGVRHKSGDRSESAENRQSLSVLGTQTCRHAVSGTVLNCALTSRPPNGRFQRPQCTLRKSSCATLHFYVAHPLAARGVVSAERLPLESAGSHQHPGSD